MFGFRNHRVIQMEYEKHTVYPIELNENRRVACQMFLVESLYKPSLAKKLSETYKN